MRPMLLRVAAVLAVGLLTSRPACAGDTEGAVKASDAAKPKVVELVIDGPGAEDPKPRQPFGKTSRNFRLELERIRAIAHDDSVKAVKLEVKSSPGLAKTLDLLAELDAVSAAGKPIVCYTETLDRSTALLATVADHLVVPPSGMIALEGIAAELMYYKTLLDKLDVHVEVLHVGDFKTAYENFAHEHMSEGQAVSIGDILDEYYGQMLSIIAENRNLTTDAVEALFGQIFVDPKDAAAAGLIDAAAYEDEFDDQLRTLVGGDYELVKDYGDVSDDDIQKALESPLGLFLVMQELVNPPKDVVPQEPYVGVVYCSGTIVSGKSQSDYQGNVSSMGSETIVKALQTVEADDNCKAVVLRVNSPGGSAMASDMIWRAIEKVKLKKPVISSMGSVAASGGYWISMGCNTIVAQPSTLTGSIGVVSMLPDVHEALANLGVNVEVVARGPHGDQLSLLKNGPTPVLRETMTRFMQETYDEFIEKVSTGRGLTQDRVRELAQGRVWTGRQAEAVGLVDSIGGLQDALDLARVMAKLPAAAPLRELPEAPNFLEQIQETMGGMAMAAQTTPLEAMLTELGFGNAVVTMRELLEPRAALDPERVQAILPFDFVVR
ncbi:MAG: signal peptide peptidase SppA [Planctomycetes bacterium]|nr:signal peptide peptidase SppA [Planctomycetota bacterium]